MWILWRRLMILQRILSCEFSSGEVLICVIRNHSEHRTKPCAMHCGRQVLRTETGDRNWGQKLGTERTLWLCRTPQHVCDEAQTSSTTHLHKAFGWENPLSRSAPKPAIPWCWDKPVSPASLGGGRSSKMKPQSAPWDCPALSQWLTVVIPQLCR